MNKRQGAAIISCLIILACSWIFFYYGEEWFSGVCLGISGMNMPWILSTTD